MFKLVDELRNCELKVSNLLCETKCKLVAQLSVAQQLYSAVWSNVFAMNFIVNVTFSEVTINLCSYIFFISALGRNKHIHNYGIQISCKFLIIHVNWLACYSSYCHSSRLLVCQISNPVYYNFNGNIHFVHRFSLTLKSISIWPLKWLLLCVSRFIDNRRWSWFINSHAHSLLNLK